MVLLSSVGYRYELQVHTTPVPHGSWCRNRLSHLDGCGGIESWEVLTGSRVERLKSLGSVPQDGSETAMVVRTPDPYVAVRAIDRSERVLGTYKPVEA